jgi:RimJ/RimL family protein N-acetyltransferase
MIEAAVVAIDKNEWPDAACLILEDEEGQFLGNIGLVQNPFLVGNLEIGFHIVAAAWGKGIATVIAKFVSDIAFSHLNA